MNIKRAKQEIKDTIEAYFLKNEWGEYEIPAIRQRPILLLGSPGIGKTQIMEQIARECEIWWLIRSHTIPDRVPSDFHLFQNIPLMEKSRQSRNIP